MTLSDSIRARRFSELEASYAKRRHAEYLYVWWSGVGTLAATLAAIALVVFRGTFEASTVVVCVTMLLLTGFGVSAGLHRHFSHHAFAAAPAMRIVLAVLGIASGQGYFIRWVHDHRVHHKFADQPGDPHSPYFYGQSRLTLWSGLIHAHYFWLLRRNLPLDALRVKDLACDERMVWLDRYSPVIMLVCMVFPGLVVLAFERSVLGLAQGVLWGGCVRMFALNQIVWGVNSVGHRLGSRLPSDHGMARNNAVLGVLAFGDGWHANHHRAPFSARHGVRWWQVDSTWYVLKLLSMCGWVHHLRNPPPAARS